MLVLVYSEPFNSENFRRMRKGRGSSPKILNDYPEINIRKLTTYTAFCKLLYFRAFCSFLSNMHIDALFHLDWDKNVVDKV